jgi:hypothetical protein
VVRRVTACVQGWMGSWHATLPSRSASPATESARPLCNAHPVLVVSACWRVVRTYQSVRLLARSARLASRCVLPH